jgi:hypothetical protein
MTLFHRRFPREIYHAVIDLIQPNESLTIRAPSAHDKIYQQD